MKALRHGGARQPDKPGRLIYGPVPSWRLGRSLGVDLVSQPGKRCSFDCAYCQLGPTPRRSRRRREYQPLERLSREIARLPALELDYVTFSGTAEPTLAANLGAAIRLCRDRLHRPVAVLTNASLLSDAGVRQDLAPADIVVAKLDAPTPRLLQEINRPVSGVTWAGIVAGLLTLRREYRGRLALQMMFYQANRLHAGQLAALAREIGPDEVQVNTPLRPCGVAALSPAEMAQVARAFGDLPVISVYRQPVPAVVPLDGRETSRRRPGPTSVAAGR